MIKIDSRPLEARQRRRCQRFEERSEAEIYTKCAPCREVKAVYLAKDEDVVEESAWDAALLFSSLEIWSQESG